MAKTVTLMTECGEYVGYGAFIHDESVDMESAVAKARKIAIDKRGEVSYSLDDILMELDEMSIDYEVADVCEVDI